MVGGGARWAQCQCRAGWLLSVRLQVCLFFSAATAFGLGGRRCGDVLAVHGAWTVPTLVNCERCGEISGLYNGISLIPIRQVIVRKDLL